MTSSAEPHQGWDPDAVPGLAPPPPAALSEQIIEVDGERFRIGEHARQGESYVYSYDWLSGPSPGYGFGSSGPEEQLDGHISAIRSFLANIDNSTGHLSES